MNLMTYLLIAYRRLFTMQMSWIWCKQKW